MDEPRNDSYARPVATSPEVTKGPEAAVPYVLDTTPLKDPEAIAERDRQWLAHVYDPHDPQLTFRSALTGMVLGAVLSASNLYIGLKIGWSFGMSITASVLAFAIFAALRRIFPSMTPFSMLENNTSQTAASAAAYMSSAGLVSAIPAMTLLRMDGTITTPELDGWRLAAWIVAISVLGVVVAIPLKRSMINAEQLRFPSGIICAETIRTMHAEGSESIVKARSLVWAAGTGALLKFIFDCKLGVLKRLPDFIAFPGRLRGFSMQAWSLGMNTSLLLYASGAIIGMKVAASLALGSVINYAVIGPWLIDQGVLRVPDTATAADHGATMTFAAAAKAAHALVVGDPNSLHAMLRSKWSVWPGTSIMVSASLVAFGFRWRTIGRAFGGFMRLFRNGFGRDGGAVDPLASVEVPNSWFLIGVSLAGTACVVMQTLWFGVPVLEGTVSVLAAFLLSVVAARATGETDVTPIGAMGKITQLVFGVIVPGNAAANLMTANVTAGAASHSADLLTEVKTGYLLGGAPRKQFWAQMLGVVAGGVVCVPVYFLIARPEKLGGELAAPAAVTWASVAKLLHGGAQNLPRFALAAIAVGLAIGATIAVLDELASPSWKRWLPSATGLGIGLVLDANDGLAMFVGALVTLVLEARRKDLADRYVVSVSSGLVAGEGLMGIAVIILRDVLHILP